MRRISTEPSATRELGQLLRSRRARVLPAEVGLPGGRRRRTPGLRREEVALLASISPTYYALIERGRAKRPSRQVLDAFAAALRLTPSERDYLRRLADDSVGDDAVGHAAGTAPERLAPEVAQLVAHLDPHPTYVTGRRWDVLAANRSARALWTDWPALPEASRNLLLWMFAAPEARSIFVEWEKEAAAQLGRFRAAAARHLDEPSFVKLIDRLLATGSDARAMWQRHDVVPLGGGHKRLRHPRLGEVLLHHVVLQVADEPEQKLVTFAPSPADERRIAALID